MLRAVLAGALLAATTGMAGAVTVYSENFDVYPDGTTTGSLGDPATGNWGITAPGLVDANDHFEVRSGRLETRDLNAASTWLTAPIPVAGFENFSLTLFLEELGDLEEQDCNCGINADYIDIAYRFGADPFTIIEDIGGFGGTLPDQPARSVSIIGDFGSLGVDEMLAGIGSTLQLRIELRSTAADEFFRIDDIVVTADAIAAAVPLPAGGVLLLTALGAGLLLRRQRS